MMFHPPTPTDSATSPSLPSLYSALRATYPTAGLETELLPLAIGSATGDPCYGVRAVVRTEHLVLATAMGQGPSLEEAEDRACRRVLALLGLQPLSAPAVGLAAVQDEQALPKEGAIGRSASNGTGPIKEAGADRSPSPTVSPSTNGQVSPTGSNPAQSANAHGSPSPLTAPPASQNSGNSSHFDPSAGGSPNLSSFSKPDSQSASTTALIADLYPSSDADRQPEPQADLPLSPPPAPDPDPTPLPPSAPPAAPPTPHLTPTPTGPLLSLTEPPTPAPPTSPPPKTATSNGAILSLVPPLEPPLEPPTLAPSASAAPATPASPPLQPVPAPAPPAPAPMVEDWGESLAQLDVEVRRLAWTPQQEAEYLQAHYGHPSRDYVTEYGELLDLIQALKAIPTPGPQTAGLPTPAPASAPLPSAPDPVRSGIEPWRSTTPPPIAAPAATAAPVPPPPEPAAYTVSPTWDPSPLVPEPSPEPQFAAIPAEIPNLSRTEMMDQVLVECDRLGWTPQQGKDYLRQTYNKGARSQLTNDELREFLVYLGNLA